ncbi:MAG: PEP-CTERM sorting domain-containing protein, partial [Azonexus sp.]|nr:PEP-CTERM sorting domain-containing protein [Azonexus sp.]
LFDAYAGLNDIVANPAAYGLADASTACAADGACDASQAFFWDGIHPTSAGHQVMARLAVAAIPEPATGLLLGLAFLGLAATRRRAA